MHFLVTLNRIYKKKHFHSLKPLTLQPFIGESKVALTEKSYKTSWSCFLLTHIKMQGITNSFSNSPSILKIKQNFWINKNFSFNCVFEATLRKSVKNMLSDKATAGKLSINVPKSSDFCFSILTECINEAFANKT